MADLAQASHVSLGQVFKLKTSLVAQEFLQEVQEEKRIRYRLRNPKSLLIKWSENYSYQKNKITNFYVMADVAEIENRLAAMCQQEGIRYAFSLTSGAIRVAPYLPYTRAHSGSPRFLAPIGSAVWFFLQLNRGFAEEEL